MTYTLATKGGQRCVGSIYVNQNIHEVHRAGILRKCCGSPGPQGGAHSTDTGPAHEPTAGSLPATENSSEFSKNIQEREHP